MSSYNKQYIPVTCPLDISHSTIWRLNSIFIHWWISFPRSLIPITWRTWTILNLQLISSCFHNVNHHEFFPFCFCSPVFHTYTDYIALFIITFFHYLIFLVSYIFRRNIYKTIIRLAFYRVHYHFFGQLPKYCHLFFPLCIQTHNIPLDFHQSSIPLCYQYLNFKTYLPRDAIPIPRSEPISTLIVAVISLNYFQTGYSCLWICDSNINCLNTIQIYR